MNTKQTQTPSGLDETSCCLSSVAEMEALEKAIQRGKHEINRLESQLAAMREKQNSRQHELGYQKARLGIKPTARVSDEARPGYRMVIAQTDAGIATRWIPDNVKSGGTGQQMKGEGS